MYIVSSSYCAVLNFINFVSEMQLSVSQKNFVNKGLNVATFAVRWGFVPFVVYLGFKQGPDPLPNGQARYFKSS